MFYDWEFKWLPSCFSLEIVRGSETGNINTSRIFVSTGTDPYKMMRSAVEYWIKSEFGRFTNLNVDSVMNLWGFEFTFQTMAKGEFKQRITSEQIREWEREVEEWQKSKI